MKTRWILCVVATLIALVSGSARGALVTLQDGAYHRLDGFYSTVGVYNNSWNEPTTVELVSGATIRRDLTVYDSSNITISGGSVGRDFYAYDNSNVIASGGTIGWSLRAYDDSNITISGGRVGGVNE